MSEIEFLTMHSRPGMTVLYAGAAPGNHIPFLAEELFPHLTFILVDPARFACKPSRNVIIRNEYFTDDLCTEFASTITHRATHLLFISDIRSMSASMRDNEKEERVGIDMRAQHEWVTMLTPAYSMLKFRLPYSPGHTKYFAGRPYLPVWGGRTTTESRYIIPYASIRDHVMQDWSHKHYEDLMYHFNTVTRTTHFAWPIDEQTEMVEQMESWQQW